MKTYERVSVSKCCGHAVDYWQPPIREYVCTKCKVVCGTKGIDLEIFKSMGNGQYRRVDNTKLVFKNKLI